MLFLGATFLLTAFAKLFELLGWFLMPPPPALWKPSFRFRSSTVKIISRVYSPLEELSCWITLRRVGTLKIV